MSSLPTVRTLLGIGVTTVLVGIGLAASGDSVLGGVVPVRVQMGRPAPAGVAAP